MNFEEKEKIAQLFDAYKNLLTQSQKQTLHLYLIEDLSYQEIADIIATTRQAVYDSIKKGIKKLEKIGNNVI